MSEKINDEVIEEKAEQQEAAPISEENTVESADNQEAEVKAEDFDFGEKKIDKKKLGKNIIMYLLSAIFFALFVINGIFMEKDTEGIPAFDGYTDSIPVIVHILLMIGALFAVGVVANYFGGEKQEEHHVKEET